MGASELAPRAPRALTVPRQVQVSVPPLTPLTWVHHAPPVAAVRQVGGTGRVRGGLDFRLGPKSQTGPSSRGQASTRPGGFSLRSRWPLGP